MNAQVQGTLVAVAGIGAAQLAASGAYLDYLKPGMRVPLLAAGMTMLVLGTLTVVRALVIRDRRGSAGPERHDDQGDHAGHGEHAPRVAWLLVLPLLALVLVDPPALGADAARRDTASATPAPAAGHRFGELPAPRDGAVNLSTGDFLARAYHDEDESLAGVRVRLTGFVVHDHEVPDGYLLTRFAMVCCAGDALPLQITVRGLDGPPPPEDTWLEVVGEWIPPAAPPAAPAATGAVRGAAAELVSQSEIPAPTYPYE